MKKFVAGDLAILMTGGPIMKVVNANDDLVVTCVWYSEGKISRKSLERSILYKLIPAK